MWGRSGETDGRKERRASISLDGRKEGRRAGGWVPSLLRKYPHLPRPTRRRRDDDATFRGRIDGVGNRQARGRRDLFGGRVACPPACLQDQGRGRRTTLVSRIKSLRGRKRAKVGSGGITIRHRSRGRLAGPGGCRGGREGPRGCQRGRRVRATQAASKARSVGREEEEGDTMLQSASHPSAQIFSDG